MPNAKDNAKLSGDTHPPELENPAAEDGEDNGIEGTPGKGENQAGFLKDRDAAGTGRDDKAG